MGNIISRNKNILNKRLFDAIAKHDINKFNNAILKTANVNAVDIKGQTPLQKTILQGSINMFETLINNGANLNVKDNKGNSLLHMSAAGVNTLATLLLRDDLLNVNIRNKAGETPLHKAALNGRTENGKILLKKGADINIQDNIGLTPLHKAICKKQHGISAMFLEQASIDVDAKMRHNIAPIHIAVAQGSNEIVDRLITKKANINAKDSNGKTPLHIAVENRLNETAKILINNNAEINAQNNKGNTPLHIAAINESIEMMSTLIISKADMTIKNNKGQIVLYSILNTAELSNNPELKKDLEIGCYQNFAKNIEESIECIKAFLSYKPGNYYEIENRILSNMEVYQVEKEKLTANLNRLGLKLSNERIVKITNNYFNSQKQNAISETEELLIETPHQLDEKAEAENLSQSFKKEQTQAAILVQ